MNTVLWIPAFWSACLCAYSACVYNECLVHSLFGCMYKMPLCVKCVFSNVCFLGSSEQPEEAEQTKQEAHRLAHTPSWGTAVGVRRAVCVGLQTGRIGHDVCHVVLFLHPVKQVSHGTFGINGYILTAMGLCIQWDCSLLHVLLIIWRETSSKSPNAWNINCKYKTRAFKNSMSP